MANDITSGVFVELIGSPNTLSEYDSFIRRNSIENPSNRLQNGLNLYSQIVNENKLKFDTLSDLEEFVMQNRFLDELKAGTNEIKLSVVREYIYARALFFRKENKIRDIRVIAQLGFQCDTELANPKSSLYLKLKGEFSKQKKFKTLEEYINSRKNDLKKEEMESMYTNKKFMDLCKELLIEAMEKQINETMNNLKLKYEITL